MKDFLQQFGMTNQEASIYLCLLENGQLTAYQAAEKSGLYRQACYDALHRMQEKGHVSTLKIGRTQVFKAVNPEFILKELQDKTIRFQETLPQLLALKKEGEDPVEVEVLQGKQCLRLAFNDIITTLKRTSTTENCCTAVDEKHYNALDPVAIEHYAQAMKKNKFKERVLISEKAKGSLPSSITTYRTVPERFFNSNPVQIYGDKIQMLLCGSPLHLILIKNQGIADSFRKQFEFMWSMAKQSRKVY